MNDGYLGPMAMPPMKRPGYLPPQEIPMTAEAEEQTKEAAADLGVSFETAKTYIKALLRWYKAGRPKRSQEEVEQIYNTFCRPKPRPCQYFVDGKCSKCGCNVNLSKLTVLNKIKMATESCPVGKWGAKAEVPKGASDMIAYAYQVVFVTADNQIPQSRAIIAPNATEAIKALTEAVPDGIVMSVQQSRAISAVANVLKAEGAIDLPEADTFAGPPQTQQFARPPMGPGQPMMGGPLSAEEMRQAGIIPPPMRIARPN
ncbi:MAG: hypothetical protein WC485_00085 [Opitutaceae bacterium]